MSNTEIAQDAASETIDCLLTAVLIPESALAQFEQELQQLLLHYLQYCQPIPQAEIWLDNEYFAPVA